MTKLYKLFLLFACFSCTYSYSQKIFRSSLKVPNRVRSFANSSRTTAGGCDTINIPEPFDWSFKIYYAVNTSSSIDGFISGNDAFGNQEKAAFFDVSSSTNTYLTKVWIAFGVANSTSKANLAKIVPVYIYDGTTGVPGALLTTVNKTLGDLKADVDSNYYSEINFPTAITLPASKKFFVSVGLTNLVWTSTEKDSLAMWSTDADEVVKGENGFGMEKYSGSWETLADFWQADYGLYIHPFVSDNPTCALALPITLVDFTVKWNGGNNILYWTTATEQNNKGFELQRSDDGTNFKTLTFINSSSHDGNSNSNINYRFIDQKPFPIGNYYRLNQVDKDGKSTLSKILFIRGAPSNNIILTGVYPNPAKTELKININAPANGKVSFVITDLAGKVVMQESSTVINGDNNLSVNVSKLLSGSYLIKAVCNSGCETAVSKFVKQ